ncbi:MAG: DUF2167 domain-containing protein [Tannerellaceae bacterium]|jgi:uncharacterized membrane-anchored protein|nr:DUF2167 domain-containing protein [Tannerellaceae bacterium]
MNRFLLTVAATLFVSVSFAQKDGAAGNALTDTVGRVDSFIYQHGVITLKDGMARIVLPKGFKYLDAVQAEMVLTEYWGNPAYEGMTLGFILPEGQEATDFDGYVFNIEFEDIGYVKDGDADRIDYDVLLEDMKADIAGGNEERKKRGYSSMELLGWAVKPYYDSDRKTLHWAKELKFDDEDEKILNYNIRLLGRKGVLMLNAIAPISELGGVRRDLPAVLNMVEFTEGNRYADFNPERDQVALWTIAGLVAGKVLHVWSFENFIRESWKVIAIVVLLVIGFFAARNLKKKNVEQPYEEGEELVAEDAEVDSDFEEVEVEEDKSSDDSEKKQ